MLKERQHLAVEQPIEQIIHDLADHLPRADNRLVDVAPPLAMGAQVSLGFEASEVSLYGLEVEPSLLGQGIQDLAYGRPAPFPDDASDFQFRLRRHRAFGHGLDS